MKHLLLLAALLAASQLHAADTLSVRQFIHLGPLPVSTPVMTDTINLQGKAFDASSLLDGAPAAEEAARQGTPWSDSILTADKERHALHTLAFQLRGTVFTNAAIHVKGCKNFRLYVDGELKGADSEIGFTPFTHNVVVVCLTAPEKNDTIGVTLTGEKAHQLTLDAGGKGTISIYDANELGHIYALKPSPTGRYMMAIRYQTYKGGRTEWTYDVYAAEKNGTLGRRLMHTTKPVDWMPHTDELMTTREEGGVKTAYATDILTGKERVIATHIPEGDFNLSPTLTFAIMSKTEEGKKEDPNVYEIVEPEDRQPGWRDRSQLLRYDFATGITQPLTFGYHSAWLLDISADGRKMLYMVSRRRMTARPTTLNSLILMDLETMKTDTLVADDGFLVSATFSPDSRQVLITASAEALGGVGLNLPEGRTASSIDNQLYMLDIATRDIKPLTRDFNPNVGSVEWSTADGMIYFNAEDRDYQHLYRLNPKNGKIDRLDAAGEEMIHGFALAADAPVMGFVADGAVHTDRAYTMSTRTLKPTLADESNAELMKHTELATCHEWNYLSERGDTVYGRYYLPHDFDAKKRYPMLVYYYGGCSPTGRNFGYAYSYPAWASMGYVVYVVQPSGATGFGQEWASRHVNTAGKGPAEDIIDGTRRFVREHAFVDSTKIGCCGASYGGFMTQYLQTQTDLFAAAVSHAGISSHTSYWGNGYWGYSYSEVSMANSYPWSDRELYVNQSPLYNADKIHTPLLFLHGDADHNVPFGESVQMFTALKLLGRETAFVAIKDQDHFIQEYDKRKKWLATMFAWFEKWLKGDSAWWDSMYGGKTL